MSVESSEVGAEPSLSEIIKGSPEPSEPVKVEPKAEPEPKSEPKEAAKAEPAQAEKAERPRGEDGKFKAKEPEAAKEKPQQPRPDWVNGLIAERRKRQAAEANAQQQQKPKTDFFENPDKAVEERVGASEQKWNERFFKLSLKAAQAQASRTDYEDVATAFAEAAERDPRLIDAMRADDDPGEFIYVVGKQIRELGDVNGDIGKYREKLKAEFSAELSEKDKRLAAAESELAKLKKQYEDLSTIRGSLNTRTSGRTSVAETDDDDLKSIVRFGNK